MSKGSKLARTSPVLRALAACYEMSLAGRTGCGARDIQPCLDDLLAAAGVKEGDPYELARYHLEDAERTGVLTLEYDNPHARTRIHKVRLSPRQEYGFYEYLGRESPSHQRAAWAELFRQAGDWSVPERFRSNWSRFCAESEAAAITWSKMRPFVREDIASGVELLQLAVRLLGWNGKHLIRWVSSVLCNDSKRLERQQKTLELLLSKATQGAVKNLTSLGIVPMEPNVTFHGPLCLKLDGNWQDYGPHHGSTALSRADIERAEEVTSDATRCLTVENKTPFMELARGRSGELLIWTSYPNEATLSLLKRLGRTSQRMDFWHFGDTDPAGFDILHDLRVRSGLVVRALHMDYRPRAESRELGTLERARLTRLLDLMPDEAPEIAAMLQSNTVGDFEQESLGTPQSASWPFYGGVLRS